MEKYFAIFKSTMQRMAALTQDAWESIEAKIELRRLSAGQIVTGLGNYEHYFIFVCEGLFREMETNNLGIFTINRYLLPGSVFIGINSETTARMETINDGTILLLSERDVYKLDYEQRVFRKHFKIFLNQYVNDLRLRGDILACKNGATEYKHFYEHYEQVCLNRPLAEQAFYLNLNKDTVCRLRAKHFPNDK